MSRSRPNENSTPNPAARWFDWNGEHGDLRYYDKTEKKEMAVALPFTFMLLDQLGSVGGWHKHSDCRIYSNEVKDTRQDVLIVKTKRDGIIAEGIYRTIKDRVAAVDGQFVANLYIAFKLEGNGLAIGSLRVKGSALHAWSEFASANRASLYNKAIEIHAFTEGKKGKITFRTPVLRIKETSAESSARATELDAELQAWLDSYFSRTRRDQVEHPSTDAQPDAAEPPDDDGYEPPADDESFDSGPPAITDDDIPF